MCNKAELAISYTHYFLMKLTSERPRRNPADKSVSLLRFVMNHIRARLKKNQEPKKCEVIKIPDD